MQDAIQDVKSSQGPNQSASPDAFQPPPPRQPEYFVVASPPPASKGLSHHEYQHDMKRMNELREDSQAPAPQVAHAVAKAGENKCDADGDATGCWAALRAAALQDAERAPTPSTTHRTLPKSIARGCCGRLPMRMSTLTSSKKFEFDNPANDAEMCCRDRCTDWQRE